jgi:hypothetical protein
MITWHARTLQPAQYRPATAYYVKLGKSGTHRNPKVLDEPEQTEGGHGKCEDNRVHALDHSGGHKQSSSNRDFPAGASGRYGKTDDWARR